MERARNMHRFIFQWLAQYFQSVPFKFSKFIQKKDAVVRQTNLTRLRIGAAANQSRLRNSVMRITERPLCD